ncbi:hypothetical protein X965_11290 [Morganella sp. EGD-HP17]|nr:hypothetical protein X965_11290 [Morganella sp. EGD-HP17]
MLACSAYRNGRRVAANYPLDVLKLSADGDKPVSVIPKNFTYDDLMALGRGCPEDDFENFGVLLIDEVSLYLNARTFKDAERLKFINWFVNSRKYGWDVYCQVQASFMLDKQLVDGMAEYVTELSRLDSLRIPFVTTMAELLFPRQFGRTAAKKSLLPHVVRYRTFLQKEKGRRKRDAIESGTFRAKDFFGVHDTLSAFGDGADGEGAYSLLPPVKLPRPAPVRRSLFRRLLSVLYPVIAVFVVPVLIVFYWSGYFSSSPEEAVPVAAPAEKAAPVARPSFVPDTPAPERPVKPVLPLSATLRLTGHITVRGESKLIVRDTSTGLYRYVPLYFPLESIPEEIEIDGERVTAYSGAGVTGSKLPAAAGSPVSLSL